MALDCNKMNGQEGSGRSTEESEGVHEQGRNQEGREEKEETPDPTHKQVTPHTREAQSEDQPPSAISRVKESVQQICLISYTILPLLYIYVLEDPDVVELLLQLLPQLWRFIKWSFVLVTDLLERTVLYHVNHIRLSPSLSRFAKNIFCQQKSYSRLSVEETDSYTDISGRQTEKERNDDQANEGGEKPSRPTHRRVTNQTQPLDQTLSEIWGKVAESFQQMFLIPWNILQPICKHFLQDLDLVEYLLLLIPTFWRCFRWAVILFVITHIYILVFCAKKVLSACSYLLGLREKIFHRMKKPLQEHLYVMRRATLELEATTTYSMSCLYSTQFGGSGICTPIHSGLRVKGASDLKTFVPLLSMCRGRTPPNSLLYLSYMTSLDCGKDIHRPSFRLY